MPIVLLTSFVSNINIVSQSLYVKYKHIPLVRLLGVWKPIGENSGIYL
jgi:hypothetical protein